MVLAALFLALRVSLKAVSIPVSENLYITLGFLPNALGGMIYGPVVALASGMISDILGNLLFPTGPFFPPFMLVEMLGSFIFAIFLYKAPLRIWRFACSKLLINILCNIIFTPIMLSWMTGRAAAVLSAPRIIKNIAVYPMEVFLLTLFINALLPLLRRLHIIDSEQKALSFSARHIITLFVLFLLGITAVLLYSFVYLS